MDDAGRFYIIMAKREVLKYYDSDTVSVVANLSKIDANTLLTQTGRTKLLHEIKQEKPYFEDKITEKDLYKHLIVKPKLDNPRLIAQDSAFMLFGIDGEDKTKHKPIAVNEFQNLKNVDLSNEIIVLELKILHSNSEKYSSPNSSTTSPKSKKSLLDDIELLGINKNKLFPEIDKSAEYQQ